VSGAVAASQGVSRVWALGGREALGKASWPRGFDTAALYKPGGEPMRCHYIFLLFGFELGLL